MESVELFVLALVGSAAFREVLLACSVHTVSGAASHANGYCDDNDENQAVWILNLACLHKVHTQAVGTLRSNGGEVLQRIKRSSQCHTDIHTTQNCRFWKQREPSTALNSDWTHCWIPSSA